MRKARRKMLAIGTVMVASIAPPSVTAIMAIPAITVGPPQIMTDGLCRVTIARTGGAGPGAPIPFRTLMLGAPVKRTTTSFTTGGSGTANRAIAAQRKAAGLPYQPQTYDPASATPPPTFAVDDRGPGPVGWAPYQRLPLTASKRVAEPFALIFTIATSATRGRIAALALSMADRPTAPPRVRLTIDGPSDGGCRGQVIQVYAPAMSAATLGRLSAPGGNCNWHNLARCPRARWPHGRVLFVSPSYATTFEYRWIDYDLLANWHFARAKL